MLPDRSLATSRLFTAPFLSRTEQAALGDALGPPRQIAAGRDIVREGEDADALFLLAEGWACRYTTTRDGGRQLPALLVPGDVGNLDSLLFTRIDFALRTLTPATIVPLARERVLALSDRHPAIARTFTWLALVENAVLGKWALSLGRRSAKERLAHLLCELSVRVGADQAGASEFMFPLTQELIADALGLTSVHVNRMMQQLRVDGLIATAHQRMIILDVAALRRVGGFDPRYLHLESNEIGGSASGAPRHDGPAAEAPMA